MAKRVTECGVRVLRNEVVDVHGLQLAGTDDFWEALCSPFEVCTKLDPTRPTLLPVAPKVSH